MNNFDSIIFDLDGTLWSALDSTVFVLKEIKKRHPDIVEDVSVDVIKSAMGCTFEETAKKYYGYLDKEIREKYTEEAILENTKRLMKYGGTLYNGVEDIIKELSKNYKLYIVSNCIEGYIESFLETSNLKDYFLDFENNGRTGLSKGDNINLLIRRNHLLNPIYVGDTDKDKEASEYAGIPFVFTSYGFGTVTKYDYKIDDISEMLTIFGEEKMIQYLWHNEEVPSDMKVYQVSGILLNDRTEVLLYEEDGRYRIPGGHPFENEKMEDTLIRECFEEVNASIDNITYLGYQEVIGDKKEPYAQVRYIAKIKKLGKNREDMDNGKLYRRLFVPLDEVNSFLNWDDVGRKMIQTVKEKMDIN